MGDTSWFFRGLATACPVCATALGEQVRSGIFGPDFLSNLLAIMLPFPVLAAAVIALHYVYSAERPGLATNRKSEPSTIETLEEEKVSWRPNSIADR